HQRAPGTEVSLPKVVLEGRVRGADGRRLLEQKDRFVDLRGLKREHTKPVHGIGVSRIRGQELTICGFGLAQPAKTVMFQSNLKEIFGHWSAALSGDAEGLWHEEDGGQWSDARV